MRGVEEGRLVLMTLLTGRWSLEQEVWREKGRVALYLHQESLEEIFRHAGQEYPYECCGLIVGRMDEYERIRPCRNMQKSLHEEDPVRHPWDACMAYTIDRAEFTAIIEEATAKGEKLIAFYHSHPNHEAYFSSIDKAAQTALGEPEFPDAFHLVLSLGKEGVKEVRCYRWNEGMGDFEELRVQVRPK